MMKKYFLYLYLLFFTAVYAQQQQQVSINWGAVAEVKFEKKTVLQVPQFDAAYMEFDPGAQQLHFNMKVNFNGKADAASLKLTNIVYENISQAEIGSLAPALIPNAVNAQISSVDSRGVWSTGLRLSPIVKEGAGYKRVKSFSFSFSAASAQRTTLAVSQVTNSVLNTGSWYRFYVTNSGVYRITRSFLASLGFDVNVDPRTIKIYGNGGRMLPMVNAVPYPTDLAENAVKFIGEEDGSFDSNDYILFYAEGVNGWNNESLTHNNLYADRTYYYVTAGAGNGKRMQALPEPSGNPAVSLTTFDDYQYYEKDLVNFAGLGRKWFGESFNMENERTFDFSMPDIDNASPVTVTVRGAAFSSAASNMSVTANDAAVGTLSFPGISNDLIHGTENRVINNITAANTIKVKLVYNNGGVPTANAWLDYIAIDYKRRLRGNAKQFVFKYNDASTVLGPIQYSFDNANSIEEVWDITDIYNTTRLINNGGASFSFKGEGGTAKQYIAVSPSDYYTPSRESNPRVTNQNLKGTIFRNQQGTFQDIDYLIITPNFLVSTAEKLAALHRTYYRLNVKVVKLEDIYQEFSSGKQDVGAIRNFVRYVYNNASSPDKRVKYVNLFGEASYDYKNRVRGNTNIVPVVHGIGRAASGTDNFSMVITFVTDDFYGAMDDNEGAMVINGGASYGLDIAVGRMLVTTVADAEQMVNKVKEYLSEDSLGRWRNEYVMLADDADAGVNDAFVEPMESIAATIGQNKNFINIRKVYLDAYVQQATSGGQRYPEAKEQLLRYINNGSLVVNYLGHGGVQGMASERVFGISDAENLTNQYKYPLFITATCDLTKFDDPLEESAGEYIYKNPKGGAIAMITTTRAIYTISANQLNERLSGYLYSYTPTNTYEYPSMAEALRLTKADAGSNQFVTVTSFVGDPALHLAVPQQRIELTRVNDVPLAESTEVLKSLSYVKLSGRVADQNGVQISDYNGEVQVTVFDKEVQRTTLNNDNADKERPFDVLGETIFRGNATVINGQFDVGFVVPRDIRIPVGNGRVSFYALKNGTIDDRTGYNTQIKIGGVNADAAADTTPPEVRLYMNDETFVSGGITNNSPYLLAYLEDLHGINTASGIGHDIIGILDGDETQQYLMNDYYEADANDYRRGVVRYPFINLEKGLHTLTFRAWDVYNNLVTAEIQFVVTGSDELQLERVLNYPNPFVNYTEFWFNHNRPYEPLDVQVQVFTVSGKIVKTINRQVTTDGFLSRDIKWDGLDDYGQKIGKGVYIYKLTVRSTVTNKKAEKFEKLVLL